MTAGYTAVVRKLVRVSVISLAVVAGVLVLSGVLFRATPQGFLPEEDQGAIFTIVQLPEGASQNRTSEVSREVEQIIAADPAVQHVLGVIGLDFITSSAASNKALIVVRLKPYEEREDPSSSPSALVQRLRPQLAAVAAASPRPSTCRRSSASAAPAASSTRCRRCRARRRPISPPTMRGLIVAANQRPELAGVFSTFAADTPQLYPRRRPREGAGAGRRGQRHLHSTAGHARRLLRQRLQPFRPHLAGQHPGRGRLPLAGRRHLRDLRQEPARRDGADAGARRRAAGARAAGADPLQQLPRCHHQRLAGTRLQHRRRAGRHGGALGDARCRPATPTSGRAPRGRRRRPRARPRSCSASPSSSPTCSWWPSTRAGTSRSRSCSRSASASWAPSPPSARRARLRRLRPDRPRRADRARRQERDPDRRVRDRAARARRSPCSTPRSRVRACGSAR